MMNAKRRDELGRRMRDKMYEPGFAVSKWEYMLPEDREPYCYAAEWVWEKAKKRRAVKD